jgi:hypothetical protein
MSFNPTLVKRSLAASLAIAAATVPAAAQAMPIYADPAPPATPTPQHQAPAPAEPTSSHTGFHWDDAGIGAAGTAALLGAGGLAAVAMRRRRPHSTLAD